ncbi:MAG: hypothetical protein EAZ08_10150 [Cytophagales bacterium]|nr:MAG: hypothetical protein EAZ08_10150 [Cytophagales bacterium]
MDIKTLLQPAHQAFILANEDADVRDLALKAHLHANLPMPLLISQIAARKKAKTKLPTFYDHKNIIYPVQLSLEQCSSEQTATFKANFTRGDTLLDLTGGFGIDTYFFSKNFQKVIYIERNQELADIAKHNFGVLGATNIEVVCGEATDFLTTFSGKADCVYLDPARRDTANKKVVLLQDCEPNILEIMPLIFRKLEKKTAHKLAGKIILKTSPMLDIDLATKELAYVNKIMVLAVENECKEVIYFMEEQQGGEQQIETVNLLKNNIQKFSFERNIEQNSTPNYALPQKYLYEPNVAILKAGGFKSISSHYQIAKLHTNSHLYTSEHLINNFVGRIFEIQAIISLNKKELQKYIPENKANISVRNFPLSVEEIRKKIGMKEGGNTFVFATTDYENKKVILICKKIA